MPIVTDSQLDSPRVRQLSDGNPVGTVLGVSAADKIAFYTSSATAPVVQPAGNAQAAITRGQAAGTIISMTTIQSPITVAPGGTAEWQMNPLPNSAAAPPLAGDLIFVNKPTAQAGLGIVGVRAVGNNIVGVAFANMTGTTITPTAAESYAVIALRGFNTITASLTPAAVAANSTAEQQFAVTGLRVGELVEVNKPTVQAGLGIVGMRVVSNNVLGITYANVTPAAITPTAGETYTINCLGGIDAANNEVLLQIAASPVSIQANTITEFQMPVTGLSVGDVVKGISKPTFQAGLVPVSARIASTSTPGIIGVAFMSDSGTTIQPTAGETYEISLYRANPVAPMVVYSQALSPTAVPGNTTAEQTFTVTGLIASTPVWVNKPSAQTNLGIVNARVSAANTLALTFMNTQASSITPTAAEVYTIGNFQEPFQTGGLNTVGNGNAVNKSAVGVIQQSAILSNAHRAALTGLGLEAGA